MHKYNSSVLVRSINPSHWNYHHDNWWWMVGFSSLWLPLQQTCWLWKLLSRPPLWHTPSNRVSVGISQSMFCVWMFPASLISSSLAMFANLIPSADVIHFLQAVWCSVQKRQFSDDMWNVNFKPLWSLAVALPMCMCSLCWSAEVFSLNI